MMKLFRVRTTDGQMTLISLVPAPTKAAACKGAILGHREHFRAASSRSVLVAEVSEIEPVVGMTLRGDAA